MIRLSEILEESSKSKPRGAVWRTKNKRWGAKSRDGVVRYFKANERIRAKKFAKSIVKKGSKDVKKIMAHETVNESPVTLKDVVKDAYNCGKECHKRGGEMTPAKHPEVMELLKKIPSSGDQKVKDAKMVLSAWQRGFSASNLGTESASQNVNEDYKKPRKPRTTGRDMCSCGALNCDDMNHMGTIYGKKRDYRSANGLCIGCGKKKDECSCKSSLKVKK